MVSDIIENGAWVFKDQSLQKLGSVIQRVHIHGGSDTWVWQFSASGFFSTSAAWDPLEKEVLIVSYLQLPGYLMQLLKCQCAL